MDDTLSEILKNQGPLGAVVLFVLFYFVKVLIPHLLASIDKLTETFRSDLKAAREEDRQERAADRAAYQASLKELTAAMKGNAHAA